MPHAVARRRGPDPVMMKLVPAVIMGNETNPGWCIRHVDHGRYDHSLARPQPKEEIACHVMGDGGDVTDLRPLPRCRDGCVGGVAAMSLQIQHAAIGPRRQLREFQHGLAHAQQVNMHLRKLAYTTLDRKLRNRATWHPNRTAGAKACQREHRRFTSQPAIANAS